ncbi:helix-turn-helix transcriptional regulator [Rhizobium halophilum]|uniref:helix-turn-helix transcriptional regulator n=1 Tax=Rhizobium halophilum TaxID=2846852 RepID=UPI001EFE8E0B|nr:helix-turn-helix transcriptional regulator [Rhizobium halophilum]MCF6367273.1 helix-turn-helix transcriptional regulator [Rhizobium halophilum]
MTWTFEDQIYEAAVVAEAWPAVLDRISTLIGAEGALLANVSDPSAPWIASEGVKRLFQSFFEGGWAYNNPKTRALLRNPHPGFISDAIYLGEDWMAEQDVYREFFWKHGFGYAAGTTVQTPSGDVIAFSIEKRRCLGPVQRNDLELLDIYRPHLARAALLATRLQFARTEAALHALQLARLPAAMVRSDGRILDRNASFAKLAPQAVVEAKDALHFCCHRPSGSYRSFAGIVANLQRGDRSDGHSFPVPAIEDVPPAIVHILPIRRSARDVFTRASFIVLVTPVGRRNVPPIEIIRGLFDLTPSEAKVGESLASGGTIQTTARDFGVSVETVRTHVKSILAKSGMERQTDFVAALAAVPPVSSS